MKTAIRTIACAAAALALVGGPTLVQARDAGVRAGAGFHSVGFHSVGYRSVGYHGGPRAYGHGGYHGRGWGPGLFIGGLGLAVGIAALNSYPYSYAYPEPVYPAGYPVYVPVPAAAPAPVVVYPAAPAAPAQKPAPDPIVYPRNGQSAAQTEADRQECNRWATTQPSAMADASVFQRATFACLDGRGYTVR